MKTDVLFYKLLSELPEVFFELIGRPAAEAQGYKLEALEIKQTSYRADGIFRPEPGDPNKPLYFLEVQFQPKERFYQRFFAKIFDYFDQKDTDGPWYARVLFADRSLDSGVPMQYETAFVEGQLERFYLEDLLEEEELPTKLEMIRLIVTPENQAPEAAQQLVRRAKEERKTGRLAPEMIEFIQTILFYKFPQWSREEIETMFELVDLKETRVYREAFEEGEVEGKKEGKLEAVPLLLEAGISTERIASNLGLEPEAVREIAAKLPPQTRSQPKRRSRSPKSEE